MLTTEIIKEWIEENFEETFKSLKRRKKKKNSDGRIERTFECVLMDGRVEHIIVVSDYGDESMYEIKHENLTRKKTSKKKVERRHEWWDLVVITVYRIRM